VKVLLQTGWLIFKVMFESLNKTSIVDRLKLCGCKESSKSFLYVLSLVSSVVKTIYAGLPVLL
jgi:hypothetical protein